MAKTKTKSFEYGIREDKTIWASFQHEDGRHSQFDWFGDPWALEMTAAAFSDQKSLMDTRMQLVHRLNELLQANLDRIGFMYENNRYKIGYEQAMKLIGEIIDNCSVCEEHIKRKEMLEKSIHTNNVSSGCGNIE